MVAYFNASPLPSDFAKILIAHDISHVILGGDTDMYDELSNQSVSTIKKHTLKTFLGVTF